MGGLMFITGILLACCAGFFFLKDEPSTEKIRFASGIIMALGYGFLGFIDDYLKVVRHQNEGLTAKQKFLGQVLLAIVYLVGIYISGTLSTVLRIPFFGQIDLGIFYYPVAVFIIVGASNAVNLTDGIDGLCSSVTFVCACGFMVMATILGHIGMTYLAAALAGGCAGYFLWNCHPARVFMGDTGSLFMGGIVCGLAFALDIPLVLILAGFVYIVETLSVILQVTYFKATHGKRLFKMSPIHHHFEMSGWKEEKIVLSFAGVSAIMCIVAWLSISGLVR